MFLFTILWFFMFMMNFYMFIDNFFILDFFGKICIKLVFVLIIYIKIKYVLIFEDKDFMIKDYIV